MTQEQFEREKAYHITLLSPDTCSMQADKRARVQEN